MVLEVFAIGNATVVAGSAVKQVIARVAVYLQVVALLTVYLVDLLVAVQVYIVSFSTVDHVFAFGARDSFFARPTVESVVAWPAARRVVTLTAVRLVGATTTFHRVGAEAAFDEVIAPRRAPQPEDASGEYIGAADRFYHDVENWRREVQGLEPLPEPVAALHRVVAQGVYCVRSGGASDPIGRLCAPAFAIRVGGAGDRCAAT